MSEDQNKNNQNAGQQQNPQKDNNKQVVVNNDSAKKTGWLIAAIVILLLAIFMIKNRKTEAPTETQVPTLEQPTEVQSESNKGASVADSGILTYSEALKSYEGRVISVHLDGQKCNATPSAITYKAGTRILVNNEDSVPLTVKFMGSTVKMSPYHYKTFALKTAGTYVLDCNNTTSASTVTVIQ